MKTKTAPPSTSEEFNNAYQSFSHWLWSDWRIPAELKDVISTNKPESSLELGCGIGRYTSYMSENQVQATGVDFSPVAIEKARDREKEKVYQSTFIVGDVTNLTDITKQFDFLYDIGCFHCLTIEAQKKYVEEANRLLKPGGTLLLWALDKSPSNLKINRDHISEMFDGYFSLVKTKFSGRRVFFVASHWYWLSKIS